MKKAGILIIGFIFIFMLVIGIFSGFAISQYYNLQKGIDIPSKCYTNLQSSKYFYDTPNPFQIEVNGFKFFVEDDFVIVKGSNTGSMRPCFRDNSYFILIVNITKEDIQIGDVVSIKRERKKDLLHRVIDIVIEGNQTYYITKGDNNNIEDEENWTFEQINGKLIGVLY